MRFDLKKKECHISVKDLVSPFRLEGQGRGARVVSMPIRASQGRVLHEKYQTRVEKLDNQPGISVENEVYVKFTVSVNGWTFYISGRADTVQITQKTVTIQEIKSLQDVGQFTLQSVKGQNFKAQLMIYAYHFHKELPSHEIKPQLILMELGTDTIQIIDVPYTPQKKYIHAQCELILKEWQSSEEEKVVMASRASSVVFPFSQYRPHQKEIVSEISDALTRRQSVMLLAPTGLGKTVGSLIPALQHSLEENLRLFIVTSKTTQQKIYAETLQILVKQGAKFNAVVITAKEKMCINDTYLCDPHFCPYLANYKEDQVKPAVEVLLKHPVLQSPYIRKIAKKERLCPFELCLDASLGCDVIVGDYNYVFNPGIRLQRYFEDTHDDCLIIVDEAHNLPTRARDYYSPALTMDELKEVQDFLKHQQMDKGVQKQCRKLIREVQKYMQTMHDALKNYHQENVIPVKVDGKKYIRWAKQLEAVVYQYIKAMVNGTENSPLPDDAFIAFIRGFSFFVYLLKEIESPEFQLLYYPKEYRLQIFCKSAHRKLEQQMKGFYAVIMQSATLFPLSYYRKMIGLPASVKQLHYPSPFPPENRLMLNYTGCSTRYENRAQTYEPITQIIQKVIEEHPGNYLAFFPSFSYMEKVATLLEDRPLAVKILKQGRNMTERHRKKTLRLLLHTKHKYVLLGVHGGIFSEGVDYEGEMGIGVFIVSPGLPSYCFEQELIKDYYQQTMNKGFEYAYRNPGMTRVIQASGRIFRSEKDRGVVILIGERFHSPYYRKILPAEWQIQEFAHVDDVKPLLKAFWHSAKRSG